MIIATIITGCSNQSSLKNALNKIGCNRPKLVMVLKHNKDTLEKLPLLVSL